MELENVRKREKRTSCRFTAAGPARLSVASVRVRVCASACVNVGLDVGVSVYVHVGGVRARVYTPTHTWSLCRVHFGSRVNKAGLGAAVCRTVGFLKASPAGGPVPLVTLLFWG